MTMHELTYQVSFNTPAFLGNAEQQAQWRTPPFKALLRQWWRIVKAPSLGYDHKRLLDAENELFGSALDGEERSRSKVQLRLSAWDGGTLTTVQKGQDIDHEESPTKKVGANTYLGYGPIGAGKDRNAISPLTSKTELRLRFPDVNAKDICSALQLAHWFGALGSRSRNGWGAVNLEGGGLLPSKDLKTELLQSMGVVLRAENCLQRDWPHAIGCDSDGLPTVWRLLKLENKQLDGFHKWEDVMFELARIKVAVRTSNYFKFTGGGKNGHEKPDSRHVLSYPSGSQHVVNAWGKDARVANQVRFKVHRRTDGKFMAFIVHLPCAVPEPLASKVKFGMPDQKAIWTEVHRLLDAQRVNGLIRLAGAT